MDALLKLAADAGHHVTTAEEAVEEGAHDAARDAVDRASDVLADLRGRWPAMSDAERRIVGPAAQVVRRRLDAVSARLPARRTLSEGTAEVDPEQEAAPDPAEH
jgi:flavin-binding protein dodecin